MNELLGALVADHLLSLLAHMLLATTVVAAVVLAVLAVWRRAAVPARHRIARDGLLVLLATPLLVWAADRSSLGVALLAGDPLRAATPAAARQTDSLLAAGHAADPSARSPDLAGADAARSGAEPRPLSQPPRPLPGRMLLSLWAGATLLLLARQTLRYRRLRQLLAELPPASGALRELVATAAREVGLPATPPVLVGAATTSPATLGWLRPVVVLPADLLARSDAATAAAIVRHEFIHIALGHHRDGMLQLLARCMFPWHPLVCALVRALTDTQELLADAGAVGNGDRVAYANGLVMLAAAIDREPSASLQLRAFGGRPFHHRITRLLGKEFDPMIRPTAANMALTTLCAGAMTLIPFAVRVLPAQDAQGKDAARNGLMSGAAFMPLVRGTTWTWHVVQQNDGQESQRDDTMVVWGAVPLDGGKSCSQLLTTIGNSQVPSYMTAGDDGIWEFRNAYLGGMRGVNPQHPTRMLPAPVGAETRWEWDEQLSYQTLDNAAAPDPETLRVHHRAELLAVDEEIKVPAGVFHCVHVRVTSKPPTGGDGVRDFWLGRDTGLVKETQVWPTGRQTRELKAFHRGQPSPFTAEQRILDHLGKLRGEPIEWLPRGEEACYLRGRFAVVRPRVGAAACIYGDDDAATGFEPTAKEFWAARVAELQPQAQGHQVLQLDPGRQDNMILTFLGAALVRVEALRQGCSQLTAAGSQTEVALDATPTVTGSAKFTGIDRDRKPIVAEGTLKTVGSELTEVTVRIVDAPPPAADQPTAPVPQPGRRQG
ncbi:MAG TPA: M56 family metallopeptidase [Planctomycetota bacterium]|nr:M56 family metallopeptidase [Planctomycetota bacterium]